MWKHPPRRNPFERLQWRHRPNRKWPRLGLMHPRKNLLLNWKLNHLAPPLRKQWLPAWLGKPPWPAVQHRHRRLRPRNRKRCQGHSQVLDQEEESENEDRLTLEQVKAKKAAHARFVRFRRSFKRSLQQLVHIDNNNISNIFELWDARCMQWYLYDHFDMCWMLMIYLLFYNISTLQKKPWDVEIPFWEVVSDFTIVPTLSCQERIAQRRSRQRGMRHSAAA